jgi:hypothetical protein
MQLIDFDGAGAGNEKRYLKPFVAHYLKYTPKNTPGLRLLDCLSRGRPSDKKSPQGEPAGFWGILLYYSTAG